MSLLDADRLAKLAGLPVSGRRPLNEGGNRSHHEDADPDGVAEWRYGKNQLAEDQDYRTGKRDKRDKTSGRRPFWGDKAGDEHGVGEADSPDDEESSDLERQLESNEIVEIDEKMLVAEISKMRRERLEENELRKVIRKEIGSILKDLKPSQKGTRRDPTRPNMGRGITMGIPGPGFR